MRVLRPLNIDTEQVPRHRRARSSPAALRARALLLSLLLLLRTLPLRRKLTHDRSAEQRRLTRANARPGL